MEEQKLVEKYKDIPDTEFVPLECVNEKFLGLYEINKLGQVKTISSGRIRDKFNKTKEGYPYVTLSSTDRTKKSIARLHVLLARTFLFNPDPKNKPIVDHINRIRDDFSLSNLRFASFSQNSLNRTSSGNSRYAYIKCDDEGNELERILYKDLDEKEQRKIRDSITYNYKYKSFTWKRVDLYIENYILKYGEPKESDWKECLRVPYFECNLNGLFRVKETKVLIFGSNYDGYIVIKHKKSRWLAHRLIYETFSGRLLGKDEVIDHISTDTMDNRFSNLSAGSQSDNLSNPLTVAKKSKRILKFSLEGKLIKKYSSVKEASIEHLGKESGFGFSHYRYSFNAFWCYEGEEDTIAKKVKTIIFRYDEHYNLVGTYVTINAASSKYVSGGVSYPTIQKFIDTGKLAPDGHYYYYGPHEFTNDEQNKNQDPDNNI